MHNQTNPGPYSLSSLPINRSFSETIHLPARHLSKSSKSSKSSHGVMPEVYSWLFPPVREQIQIFMDEYPMERFLENIHPGLDDAHLGLFAAFQSAHPEIQGLEKYENSYPLSGSSEGIFHLIAHCITNYPALPLYALANEYRGYQEFAKSLGRNVQLLDEAALLSAPHGILFISNPSARDGNYLDGQLLSDLLDRHKTIMDLAYVGIAPRKNLNLGHENILAVVTSLSKPFGLYYYRVGMLWSRESISSLYANKWFKNLHGILLAEKVIKHFNGSMHEWVRNRQKAALDIINQTWETDFQPSDVALLATAPTVPKSLQQPLAAFKRGEKYRICLTPLMMTLEGDMQMSEEAEL